MRMLTPVIIFLLLSGCDTGSQSTQIGKVVKVTILATGHTRVDMRVDCRNSDCPIDRWYVDSKDLNYMALNISQRYDRPMTYIYKDYGFFNVLENFTLLYD